MRAALFAALGLCTLAPIPTRGQVPSTDSSRACKPTGDLVRVAQFMATDAGDSARAMMKPSELLLATLGDSLRASLGAKPGELPIGEPKFTIENRQGAVRVTLFRDGRLALAVTPDSTVADSARTVGVRVLANIIRAKWDAGERVFWPEAAKGDSASFRIFFWLNAPARDGTERNPPTRFAVAAFSIALPWEEPARVDDMTNPEYPEEPRTHRVEGSVTLQFVVDTSGHALLSTMRDLLPRGAVVPVGEMADYYQQFVRAAAKVIPKIKFQPAMIGGCKVRQMVQLPFQFKLNDVR